MPRTPSIRNWKTSPPAGGWSLSYRPPEVPSLTIEAIGHNYTDILQQITQWRRNNNLPLNEAEIFQWANSVWCARDPVRCTAAQQELTPVLEVAGTGQRILTPTDYGKACWTFLNTYGVIFDQFRFYATINQIKDLLNPVNSSGCKTCHAHFREFQAHHPPHLVTNARQAAVWVWSAHDDANVYSGKPHRPSFRTCTTLFGWEPLTQDQFTETLAQLTTTP